MATYSIRDLEKLSGIKAHTIRIWEQRYDIIEPKRTPTNIRYYNDDDLQYLLNIAFLNRNGMRISKIAKLGRKEITERVSDISQESTENSNHVQTLTMAMIELNEEKFEALFQSSLDAEGFEKTIMDVIIPFLEKLSLLWLTGSISTVHEHFINNLIQQRIAAQISQIPVPKVASNVPKAVLFEPKGEDQEVFLMLMNYFLRSRGCPTLYLGSNIQMDDLQIAVQLFEPNAVFTTISDNNNKQDPQDYLQKLGGTYEHLQVFAATHAIPPPKELSHNITLFEDFTEFVDFLDDLV